MIVLLVVSDQADKQSSGVMGMKYAIHTFTGLPYDTPKDDFVVGSSDKALVTSILSAGTFFGVSYPVYLVCQAF